MGRCAWGVSRIGSATAATPEASFRNISSKRRRIDNRPRQRERLKLASTNHLSALNSVPTPHGTRTFTVFNTVVRWPSLSQRRLLRLTPDGARSPLVHGR
ncbi:unnamed protein product [Ectocarpus sp. 13 AM-2016]